MKRTFAISAFLAVCGCATEQQPTPAQVLIAPHGEGEIGVGESWVGEVSVTKGGALYSGQFTFVSDAELSGGSSAYGPGGAVSSSQNISSSTGDGKLILIGDNNDVIRCDLRYSMRGNGQAIGTCVDSANAVYDITIR